LENIQVTIDEQGIALLELNRPDVLNVLSAPLLTERQYQRQLCDAPFFIESVNRFLGK
jgi:enoyl-CoA hydratase/carnithine racemase